MSKDTQVRKSGWFRAGISKIRQFFSKMWTGTKKAARWTSTKVRQAAVFTWRAIKWSVPRLLIALGVISVFVVACYFAGVTLAAAPAWVSTVVYYVMAAGFFGIPFALTSAAIAGLFAVSETLGWVAWLIWLVAPFFGMTIVGLLRKGIAGILWVTAAGLALFAGLFKGGLKTVRWAAVSLAALAMFVGGTLDKDEAMFGKPVVVNATPMGQTMDDVTADDFAKTPGQTEVIYDETIMADTVQVHQIRYEQAVAAKHQAQASYHYGRLEAAKTLKGNHNPTRVWALLSKEVKAHDSGFTFAEVKRGWDEELAEASLATA